MPERYLQRVTWALLPFILWTFAGGPAYAALAATEQSREAQLEAARKALPRDFDDVVAELGVALKAVAANEGDALEKAKSLRAEIDERDVELRKEFADVEAMIRDTGMPEEILQRHRDFVAEYDKRLSSVKVGLDKVESGAVAPEGFFERAWFNTKTFFTGDPVRQEAAGELEAQLESYRPRKIQKSFKPEDLPFRRMTPENTPKPKETAEEWRKALAEPSQNTASLQKAMGAVADTLISPAEAQTSDLPGPEDLAETIEVQFTPEIVALAAELNNNPVEIYNWVRNNIEFVPTWGSIQGADYCRQARVCNAFDTSSLLIALLRTSGIPARYQLGTIEVEDVNAKNWLGGFRDLESAGRFAAAGGTPTTLHSKLDGSRTLRVEHVWVQTFVDYIPSQGAVMYSPDTWIQLDPSFKLYDYSGGTGPQPPITVDLQQTIADVQSNSTFDATGALTSFDLTTIRSAFAEVANQVESAVAALGPISSVGEFIGLPRAERELLPVLPLTEKYIRLTEGVPVSTIPSSLRHRLTIQLQSADPFVVPALSFSASLPELASKRLILDFVPATDADREAMLAYLSSLSNDPDVGIESLSATFLKFRPRLMVGDSIVVTGPPLRLGEAQEFNLIFGAPGAPPANVENEINVGEFVAIALDVSRISNERMRQHSDRLVSLQQHIVASVNDPTNVPLPEEDARAEYFASILDSWFASVDFLKEITYHNADVAWARYPSAGLMFSDLAPQPRFGLPYRVRSTGTIVDIDRNLSVSESRTNDTIAVRNVTFLQGVAASSLESNLPLSFLKANPEYTEPGFAYSAVDVVIESLERGIPLLSLDSSNFESQRGRLILDEGSFADVSAAVAAGRQVIVPERPLLVGNRSISGFFVIDPDTGAGDYIIGQSFSGGLFETLLLAFSTTWSFFLPLFEECAGRQGCNGSSALGKGWATFAKYFGVAKDVIGAAADTYWILDNEQATTEQKNQALIVVWLIVVFSISLSIASTGAGPLGLVFASLIGSVVTDYVKNSLLERICTCFVMLFDVLRRFLFARLIDSHSPGEGFRSNIQLPGKGIYLLRAV